MTADTCPSCGERLLPGANFCRECGEAVPAADPETAGPADADPTAGEATDEVGPTREPPSPPPATGEAWTAADVEDGKLLAAIGHLLALVTWLFGPLIVMLVSENPFVVQNAKNAVMWQLMFAIYSILAAFLVIILVGIPLLMALWFLNLAFVIVATVKATEGNAWKYPLTPAV